MRLDTTALLEAAELLTVAEAASLLGVTKQYLYNKINLGDIKTVDGPVMMIDKTSLAKFLNIDIAELALKRRQHDVSSPTQIMLPAAAAEGYYIVLNEEGIPDSLWVGKPGKGTKYKVGSKAL